MSIGQMTRLYVGAEWSLSAIGREAGVAKSTVRYRLIAAGVKMRSPGGNQTGPTHEELARTAFMYERMGLTTTEISEELGIRISSVQNRLKNHGVKMRSRSESAKMRWSRRPKARAA